MDQKIFQVILNLEIKNNILAYLSMILFLSVIGSSTPVDSEHTPWPFEILLWSFIIEYNFIN